MSSPGDMAASVAARWLSAARTEERLPPDQWDQGEFLRLGEWPRDERSKNFRVVETLSGVSAYEFYVNRGIYWVDIRPSESLYSMFRQVAAGERKIYLIRATRIGYGPDGEPLVRWIRKVDVLHPTEVGYQGLTADQYAPRAKH